jgi:hypothetical protein
MMLNLNRVLSEIEINKEESSESKDALESGKTSFEKTKSYGGGSNFRVVLRVRPPLAREMPKCPSLAFHSIV